MDVLVTGASSGFGRLTVESLARRGHRVVAGLREIGGRNEKAAAELTAFAGNLRVVELDVTDQDSVDRAVAGLDRLDAVVNNAGGIFAGPVEAFTAEEAARQLDVNVLGALRVGRAVLPGLRRQGSGVLIQVGSLSGRVALPFSGLYAASKAALGSITEAWHHELAPFGVESVVVEAASYPTSIGLNATAPADAGRMAPYAEAVGGFTQAVIKSSTEQAADPQVVADAVVELVETPAGRRPLRRVVAHAGQQEPIEAFNRLGAEATRAVAEVMGVRAYVR
jgi:NAD(P)-dependent dehydrogenase (short-subunit alcohol dehydrogenase family)